MYVDDGGDSESSQYMRDILQVEEQSRCNQLKNKAAQNNIGKIWLKLSDSHVLQITIYPKSGSEKKYLILYNPIDKKFGVKRIGQYIHIKLKNDNSLKKMNIFFHKL